MPSKKERAKQRKAKKANSAPPNNSSMFSFAHLIIQVLTNSSGGGPKNKIIDNFYNMMRGYLEPLFNGDSIMRSIAPTLQKRYTMEIVVILCILEGNL